ncbi:MAG: hypothetical protein ACQETH_05820 [Candidatus Rifleibacteriota bacterium]
MEKEEKDVMDLENQKKSDAINDVSAEQDASSEETKESKKTEVSEKKPNFFVRFIKWIWNGLVIRQFFQKIFSLFFALAVFGFIYMHMTAHRSILTYMGTMLLMVIVYAEILVIRDHLWVIEGSMRESRRWREVFFNQSNLRRQKIRKLIVMIFALGIFSYVYMRTIEKFARSASLLSFLGLILMITILYYEILTIRDEVSIMLSAVEDAEKNKEEKLKRDEQYEKFIKAEKSEDADQNSSNEV